MYNLPNSSELLNIMLEHKNILEAQNYSFYQIETDNKKLKNFENQINDNSFLKENKEIKESKAENIELKNLNSNNINIPNNSNFKKTAAEKKNETAKIEKNRNIEDYQKRKAIASYFHDKINFEYFQILQNFEINEKYLKYKILFDALKLSNDKMQLSRNDFAKYLVDCTSYEIEYNRDIDKFKQKKKLLLFHVAKQKLKIDFDIVNILKTIDQFNDFKEIIMNEDQSKLFDFAIKKISNKDINKNNSVKTNEKNSNGENERQKTKSNIFFGDNIQEYEQKFSIIKQTEEGLDEIFEECLKSGPSTKHINLLKFIGINPELIKEFEELRYSSNGKFF
jgi:hypothetical protein